MYFTRIFFAGKYAYVKSYTPTGGIPAGKRTRRQKDTPLAMKKYNNTLRSEKLQLLILANFEGGYHVTLNYPKDGYPKSYEEAEKILQRLLYKTTRRLKKEGKKFKYLAVTERGKRRAVLHHHLIIEHDPDVIDHLMAIWGHRMHISVMYEEGQYKDLADYFIKAETKEEQAKGKGKYHRSRNLSKPREKLIKSDGHLRDAPYVPPGYRLIEESYQCGYNEFIHIRWQKYMLEKLGKAAGHPTMSVMIGTDKEPKKESFWKRLKDKVRKLL